MVGDNCPNLINGKDGNDKLSGLGGDDRLWGGDGDDQLYGGCAEFGSARHTMRERS